MKSNLLAGIPLFLDFPADELDRLHTALESVDLEKGEILFQEGDPGERMYIVANGEIEILISPGAETELLLNIMHKGEYFGEISLLQPNGQRTTSARARCDASLLSMSRAQFDDLLHRYPELAKSMTNVLSQRLVNANDVKTAQERLIERKRMERELELASDIQISILPEVLPSSPDFDFGGRIQPARQVGGDFYDVFDLGNQRVGVLIGDVADKGIPSAIFMARTHALITAEAYNTASPGNVLRKVNKHLMQHEKSAQFVTALYGVLNFETGEFSYARAGNEPPLLLDSNGNVQRLSSKKGMALGLVQDIILDENVLFLQKETLLLFFTDGLTDCRDPNGEPYDLEGVMEALVHLKGDSAQVGCDKLFEKLMKYQDGSKQDDDVTLLAIHTK